MKTKLMASVCVFGLLFGYSSVTLAGGKQPDDAIKQNIDKNGAFHPCGGGGAITNGHVVFGANSAIVPASANGSIDSAGRAAVLVGLVGARLQQRTGGRPEARPVRRG